MGEIEIKKTDDIVNDVPVTEEPKEEVEKEIDPAIVEYVSGIVNEIMTKYDAKYDELKTMIESPKAEPSDEEIIELRKEIKELRKEVGQSSQSDSIIAPIKKKKTLLS
jgi:hypothetical protein